MWPRSRLGPICDEGDLLARAKEEPRRVDAAIEVPTRIAAQIERDRFCAFFAELSDRLLHIIRGRGGELLHAHHAERALRHCTRDRRQLDLLPLENDDSRLAAGRGSHADAELRAGRPAHLGRYLQMADRR